jgi:1-acyl-sn-glycerol-3-phosphate acyltransferase
VEGRSALVKSSYRPAEDNKEREPARGALTRSECRAGVRGSDDQCKHTVTSTEMPAVDRAADPVAYRLAKALLSRPLRRFYDIEVEGDARLPDGPVVLAANHRSFMDSIFLALVVDRPVSFLAKAEYFDRRRTAWIFRSTGQIPLWRGDPRRARRAIDAALGVLARGGVVGVYPEGTRSRDGMLHRGTLGAGARLATT